LVVFTRELVVGLPAKTVTDIIEAVFELLARHDAAIAPISLSRAHSSGKER